MPPSVTDHAIERKSFIAALRLMKARPVTELFEFIDSGSDRAQKLGSITVAELGGLSPDKLIREELMLELAMDAHGEVFDRFALTVLHELYPESAKAAYLTQRLGGPRWKLQAAMARLQKQGKITRTGETSGRRYLARRDAVEDLRGQ